MQLILYFANVKEGRLIMNYLVISDKVNKVNCTDQEEKVRMVRYLVPRNDQEYLNYRMMIVLWTADAIN